MGITTTAPNHLSPLEWNLSPTTSLNIDGHLRSTAKKGFVLGTSFEHYRGWKMWMINTQTVRISNTVFHKHKHISNPTVTPDDTVIAADQNLAAALKSKMPHYLQESPFSELARLSKIFSDAAAVPTQNKSTAKAAIPELESKGWHRNFFL